MVPGEGYLGENKYQYTLTALAMSYCCPSTTSVQHWKS